MIKEKEFKEICRKIRILIIENSFKSRACHLGSSLSAVEILVDIFYNHKRKQDYFIFSKASGAAALYSLLALKGYFPQKKIAYYLKNYPLSSTKVPGVLHDAGSLGHNLPISCGLALANRKKKVYVLMSDGECDEGTTYESALFARQHKLNNLYVYIDANGFQACGKTKDILDLTIAFEFLKKTLPNVEIIKTIKGTGISFCENDNSWHYRNLTLEERDKALKELK